MTQLAHKTLDTTLTAADLGEFSAIAACYTLDRDGERIKRGAFGETIGRWQSSGKRLPLHWNHSGSAADIIGSVDPASMQEQDAGLYVEGRLDLDQSDVAREAWRSMKNSAVALSFGFLAGSVTKAEDGVPELDQIDLYEVSIVPAPANPDTHFLSLKSAESEPVSEEPNDEEPTEVKSAPPLRRQSTNLLTEDVPRHVPEPEPAEPQRIATADLRRQTFEALQDIQ